MKSWTWGGALAGLMVLVAAVLVGWVLLERGNTDYTSVESRPLGDATRTAIDLQLEQSRTLYQVCVGFFAVLWGLVLAKKGDVRIRPQDRDLIIMFMASNLLLLFSVACHLWYVDAIADAYAVAGAAAGSENAKTIPDIFDPKYHSLLQFQLRFVVAGGPCGLITLITAYRRG